jgi:hypothetical protein
LGKALALRTAVSDNYKLRKEKGKKKKREREERNQIDQIWLLLYFSGKQVFGGGHRKSRYKSNILNYIYLFQKR